MDGGHDSTGGSAALLSIDGLQLKLRRYSPRRVPNRAILLLHGGNTSSRLYREPNGGLVQYLVGQDWDVWLLDWRSSAEIVDPLMDRAPLGGSVEAERALFTLDRVAELDIPAAVRYIRTVGGVSGELAVVGFCLSGCALSMSIARQHLRALDVGNVVLITMGLFFEVPWDGWVKVEDFIIERLLSSARGFRGVNAARPKQWPADLENAYSRWPAAWLSSGGEPIDELFRRLTFMYGQPYRRPKLTRAFEQRLTRGFFGTLHAGLFLHAGQCVRRGYAATFDAQDILDRPRLCRGLPPSCPSGDLDPLPFRNIRVTLIAGAEDHLWHRDSIDLMYEWLRNRGSPGERDRHRKHVLADYGHLDLFWSDDAKRDVYPLIEAAAGQPALPTGPRIRGPIQRGR